MAFRQLKQNEFTKMAHGNAKIAMNCNSSMGFSKIVSKDIQLAESTGDWSELLLKAQKSTVYFRNNFYR
jgi:hypothetical protein